MSRKSLRSPFFNRPTLKVAEELLGKFLVRRWRGKEYAAMITEVEAYDGLEDKASHAHQGKTKRNAPMYGPPGHWYVYFAYGMHWLINITTGPKNYPAAVLIRGVEGVSGPGRVGKWAHVSGALSGKAANRESGFWIENSEMKIPKSKMRRTPRIGVDYAGLVWSKKRYRFHLQNN